MILNKEIVVMNEEKKRIFSDRLNLELLRYWKENIVDKEHLGKIIVENRRQRLSIDNIDEILCSICCSFEREEDLPTIHGSGRCFVKTPSGEGSVSQNIKFSINNSMYNRVIEGDNFQIIIHGMSLYYV